MNAEILARGVAHDIDEAKAASLRDVDRLYGELVKATATPEMTKTLASLLFLRNMSTPDEYAKIIRNELDTWGPLIKALNISLDQ